MGWTFFWLMVALKLPIVAAIAIVWWAIRAEPDPSEDMNPSDDGDDGGSKVPTAHLPRPRRPRRPRGPHGSPTLPSPPRVRRRVVARSRVPR